MTPERKARVWLWCAWLMQAELTEAEYRRPRASDEELDMLEAARLRFHDKADEVAGRELTDAEYAAALDAFEGVSS